MHQVPTTLWTMWPSKKPVSVFMALILLFVSVDLSSPGSFLNTNPPILRAYLHVSPPPESFTRSSTEPILISPFPRNCINYNLYHTAWYLTKHTWELVWPATEGGERDKQGPVSCTHKIKYAQNLKNKKKRCLLALKTEKHFSQKINDKAYLQSLHYKVVN